MKARTACAAAVAACISLQLALPCRAQAPAPSASSSQQQTVEQLANQAFQLHQQGKFAESIATYLKAYEISKASEILFNVATIYDRKLHERELAADYYRRYIRTPDPNPDLVKRATERLTTLKKETEDEEAQRNAAVPAPTAAPSNAAPSASAPASAAPSSTESPDNVVGHGWHTAGIVTGAVGLASVTASLILGGLAKNSNDKANSECNGSTCSSQQGVNDARDAGTFATVSTATFIAGMAVLAAGVTMYIAAPSSSGAASQGTGRITVTPSLGPSGGGMAVLGRF
jgi:hypothetical protein